MKFKIYQSYFRPEQLAGLDPEFEPIDNTVNLNSELREHPINLRCRDLALAADLDVWGMFSWKWRQKMPYLTAQHVINYVNTNANYDIYVLNAFPGLLPSCRNVWTQGQECHPYMIEICQELFPKLGLDSNLLFLPMQPELMCWANYYLGNRQFWTEWLDLIDRYLQAIPQLTPHVRRLHDSGAGYGPGMDLNYFPFIHERLFSTFLMANRHRFRIKSFHGP